MPGTPLIPLITLLSAPLARELRAWHPELDADLLPGLGYAALLAVAEEVEHHPLTQTLELDLIDFGGDLRIVVSGPRRRYTLCLAGVLHTLLYCNPAGGELHRSSLDYFRDAPDLDGTSRRLRGAPDWNGVLSEVVGRFCQAVWLANERDLDPRVVDEALIQAALRRKGCSVIVGDGGQLHTWRPEGVLVN